MKELPDNIGSNLDSVTIIGNYEPRRCGIATFTKDLVESLLDQNLQCSTIALNDVKEGYDYPQQVGYEINQEALDEYHTAAEYLAVSQSDMVCLQHEFGIFGGTDGEYILSLLENLSMPVVTTLHTILTDPTSHQREITDRLADLSDILVVMSKSAVNILHTIYNIPTEKIRYIPHGIPDMSFVDPNYYKEQFNLLGKKTLLTFGLLSKDKGIEYVIKGLAQIVDQFPDLRYIILGETHPKVLASEGEEYRQYLQQLVKKLGLEEHVIFKNKFVSFDKLCTYLGAADIYITPYTNEQQITSGTLAYAAGTGKAVISTPYIYAKEMLSNKRGCLVPFKDDEALGACIADLFEDDSKRHQMRKKAYDYNRNATWQEVGKQYALLFRQVKAKRNRVPHPSVSTSNKERTSKMDLPKLKLDHLIRLTDDTGIVQHATYTIPNRDHGYCTDDNARALMVALEAKDISYLKTEQGHIDSLIERYLAFLMHAYNPKEGFFRNYMTYDGKWQNKLESEVPHSRAMWALGTTVLQTPNESYQSLSSKLFRQGLTKTKTFYSIRAIAFSLIGIGQYLKVFEGDLNARHAGQLLAHRFFDKLNANATAEWPWPENELTYANGIIPRALMVAGQFMDNKDMIQWATCSLDWLLDLQTEDGHLSPIGNHGWYHRGEKKARFDQQPIEAHALLEACIEAHKITEKDYWLEKATICLNWFLGRNDMHAHLYNPRSGGCRDGLQSNGSNQNEGAESTLAWLQSLAALQKYLRKEHEPNPLESVSVNNENTYHP